MLCVWNPTKEQPEYPLIVQPTTESIIPKAMAWWNYDYQLSCCTQQETVQGEAVAGLTKQVNEVAPSWPTLCRTRLYGLKIKPRYLGPYHSISSLNLYYIPVTQPFKTRKRGESINPVRRWWSQYQDLYPLPAKDQSVNNNNNNRIPTLSVVFLSNIITYPVWLGCQCTR